MLSTLPNKYKRRKILGRRRINSKIKFIKHPDLKDITKTHEEYSDSITLHERVEIKDTDPVIFKVGNESAFDSHEVDMNNNGSRSPKIAITTSKTPSKRLLIFTKELRLIFPNSECVTRGDYVMSQMINTCKAHGFTDLIVVHEYREVPDSLVICHLPYGLTTSFTLSGVIMHHDMPVVARMSEQMPHIVFNNFRSYLSRNIMLILKYLLPWANSESQRVITFTHEDGYISFRQHTLRKNLYSNHGHGWIEMIDDVISVHPWKPPLKRRASFNGRCLTFAQRQAPQDRFVESKFGDGVEPKEAGPRFQLKLIDMKLETPEALDAVDAEWVLRPYLNTSQLLRRLG